MKRALVGIILALAFVLRILFIGDFPAGFNADEASFGYDAYSILKTGRDQWGNPLPVVLKSFGDYKSPVYAYLAIPSVALFGLNVPAVRLPNAIIGTLAVFAVYLLVKETRKLLEFRNSKLEIIASILLATNPWSIMMSRGAFEANLITFFLPMAIFFFLKGVKDYKFFIWSAIFFGINLFTYHSAKLITPLVILGLVFIFRENLKTIGSKKMLIPIVIIFVFFSGLIYSTVMGGGARIAERSITQGALEQGFDERMKAISEGVNPRVAKILHNRYQVIAGRFIYNYSQYFSYKFLVQHGAGDASYGMTPGIGVINGVELILLAGIFPLLFLDKKYRKLIYVLIGWLAIAPLSAALATGIGYSGNRAEGMLPVLQILGAFGLYGWYLLIQKIKHIPSWAITFTFCILLAFGTFKFVISYFKNPSNMALKQQVYGSMDASSWLAENAGDKEVVVSRGLTEPQIFIAFAKKWDPGNFQKYPNSWGFDDSGLSWVDQLGSYSVGNYTFKSVDLKKDMVGNKLIVLKADEFDGSQIPVATFRYPDGTPNIYILDINQKIYAQVN